MITFPNCKINLGLYVTGTRADGYHELETVFYPVPLEDALEITTPIGQPSECSLECMDKEHQKLDIQDNLVLKAYHLLRKDYELPVFDIALYKHIPSGAGLGGGSADATFMLKLINEYCKLKISDGQLEKYASQLGADCAFFVRNKPTYACGIGDVFSPIELSLKGYQIVIVKPDIFVSTREAFADITPRQPEYPIREAISQPVSNWKQILKNDFELSVFPKHPELAEIKQKLYDNGAIYAAMSGSGSSLYGIYKDKLPSKDVFKGMFYFHCPLI